MLGFLKLYRFNLRHFCRERIVSLLRPRNSAGEVFQIVFKRLRAQGLLQYYIHSSMPLCGITVKYYHSEYLNRRRNFSYINVKVRVQIVLQGSFRLPNYRENTPFWRHVYEFNVFASCAMHIVVPNE